MDPFDGNTWNFYVNCLQKSDSTDSYLSVYLFTYRYTFWWWLSVSHRSCIRTDISAFTYGSLSHCLSCCQSRWCSGQSVQSEAVFLTLWCCFCKSLWDLLLCCLVCLLNLAATMPEKCIGVVWYLFSPLHYCYISALATSFPMMLLPGSWKYTLDGSVKKRPFILLSSAFLVCVSWQISAC